MIRLGFIVTLVALIGLLVSGLVALRVYDQEMALERTALNRAIEVHANLAQERLTERELLTRVAVGLIRSSAPIHPSPLQPLRASIYAFKTDFVVASWIAHISPSEIPDAERMLADSGYANPVIRNNDDTPLRQPLPQTLDVLLDIEPRTAETVQLPGKALDLHSNVGPTLREAAARRAPAASLPLILNRLNTAGIFLAAPVFAENSDTLIGFITFSYRLGPLVLANDETSLFEVALADPSDSHKEYVADSGGNAGAPVPVSNREQASNVILQTVSFSGRDLTLRYYAKVDPTARAQSLAAIVLIVGAALTCILCGLFGYVAYNNVRLSREIEARISFEARLSAVIAELNHRVKNILAVIQSIVTRTMRPGTDVDRSRELLIGRIHAMSHVVSLLSDSHWQGVRLINLLELRAIPHGDRIVTAGPDLSVSSRAAQSLCLMFFELAAHADIGHTDSEVNIAVSWDVQGKEPDSIFHLKWEEFNTSEATRNADNDFGAVLLDRVAPEALGGTSKRYFTDTSYVYEITAPLRTVVDQVELDRTRRLSGLPVKPNG